MVRFLNIIVFIVSFLIQSNLIAQQITIDKDGVKHIHNTASVWGNNTKVELQFVRKIGELNTTDSNYVFYHPIDICKDSAGNIYFLDKDGGKCIRKFDKDWKFVKNIGRMGQGPGEFTYPLYLNIDKRGNLYILNFISGFFIVDPKGKEIKRFNIPYPPYYEEMKNLKMIPRDPRIGFLWDPINYWEFGIFNNGNLLLSISGGGGSFDKDFLNSNDFQKYYYTFRVINSNGENINYFGKPNISLGNDGKYHTIYNSPFIVDKNDDIYISYAELNEIEKRTPYGQRIIFVTDRLLDHNISKYLVPKNKNEFNLVSRNIGVDDSGRIWVATYTKETYPSTDPLSKENKVRFDVFTNDGIWLGIIPVPVRYNSMYVIDNSIYFIVDEISIVEYKIVEK